ncbi:hypothetical protein QYM36_019753 [Artemia franciscana]|uniref:Reverse transcriptase domain-containing protein n=1 Tax=Artemia franciscana TaxID=6661 RepID=A0AA88H0U9_ARTSF|nr:hypothetical protein QYM36_019753 [Artemia franciscana]
MYIPEPMRAFFYHICIFSMSLEEHLDYLRVVLERLREHGATAGPDKAKVTAEIVQYLGHIVGSGRLEPSFSKVNAVKAFPRQNTKSQLRSFLGLL